MKYLLPLLVILTLPIAAFADVNPIYPPACGSNSNRNMAGCSSFGTSGYTYITGEKGGEDTERNLPNFVSTENSLNACLGTTGAGLQMTPSSCVGYNAGIRGTETGSITFANSTTTWVAMDACNQLPAGCTQNNPNLPNFSRVAGTHYLTDSIDATQPAASVDSQLLMEVVTSGGSITSVTDLRNLSGLTNNGVVNVRTYGATGNGTTDDAPAINAASSVARHMGRCVYFPAGKYLVNEDLNFTSNTSQPICVGGDSPATSIIQCNDHNGNCLDLSGADMFKVHDLQLIGGTSSANAPKTDILLARVVNDGFGHTLDRVWTINFGPYTIFDYGAEIAQWTDVRSNSAGVVISSCNHAGITSAFQTLTAPPTSMSAVNIKGGNFNAGNGLSNCAISFDNACATGTIHNIEVWGTFLGEMAGGGSGFCDVAGGTNQVLDEIDIADTRLEAADSNTQYRFIDFTHGNSYVFGLNMQTDDLGAAGVLSVAPLAFGGFVDDSKITLNIAGGGLGGGVLELQGPGGRADQIIGIPQNDASNSFVYGTLPAGETGNYFQWFDGGSPFYGHVNAGGATDTAVVTTLTGTSAGSVQWSQPMQGIAFKQVMMYFNGYENTTASAQTITFPVSFLNMPIAMSAGCPASGFSFNGASASMPVSQGSPFTGQCILGGY